MRKPRRWRKFPYYKVQVYSDAIKVWKDERKVFETAEAALEYVDKEIKPHAARIIMVVGRQDRHVYKDRDVDLP